MPVIREDKWGPWAAVGGYVTRPVDSTSFKVGQKVKGHHRVSTCEAPMSSHDGTIKEVWTTTGTCSLDYLAGRVPEAELEAAYGYYVLGSGDLSYWMNKED